MVFFEVLDLGWDAAEKGNFRACQIARGLNVF